MSELPPAGWYDDPTAPGQERWWNGAQWSEQIRPKAVAEYQHRAGELRRVSDFMGHAFGLIRARWDDFLLIAALATIVTSLAALFLIRPIVDAINIVDNDVVGFEFPQFGLLFAFAAIGILVSVVAVLAQYRIAWEAATDQRGSWSSALLYGISNTPRLIGWGMLAAAPVLAAVALVVVLAQLASAIAFIGFLAIFVGTVWWAMVISFLPMAIVVQPPASNPIPPSVATVKGRWWRLFGRSLLFGLVIGLGAQVIGAIFAQLVGTNIFGIELIDAGNGEIDIVKNLGSPLDFLVGSLATILLSFASYAGQAAAVASMAFDVMPRPDTASTAEPQPF